MIIVINKDGPKPNPPDPVMAIMCLILMGFCGLIFFILIGLAIYGNFFQ